jgi:hypothetical protein
VYIPGLTGRQAARPRRNLRTPVPDEPNRLSTNHRARALSANLVRQRTGTRPGTWPALGVLTCGYVNSLQFSQGWRAARRRASSVSIVDVAVLQQIIDDFNAALHTPDTRGSYRRLARRYIEQAAKAQAEARHYFERWAKAQTDRDLIAEVLWAMRDAADSEPSDFVFAGGVVLWLRTFSGRATVTKSVCIADVAGATDSLAVTVEDDDASARVKLAIAALVLIWVLAIALPVVMPELTPKEQEILDGYLATISLVLPGQLALLAYIKRKRKS